MNRRVTYRPPDRNGVGPSRVVLPAGSWHSLLSFLAHQFPSVPIDEWQVRMQRGDVLDAEGNTLQPSAPYRANTQVFYYRDLPPEPPIPFDETIVYQDDHLLVVDKPHFLPVTPAGRYVQETLLVRLKNKLNLPALSPVHRIDRETAGLVLFSIRADERNHYQTLFRDRTVSKTYEAIAPWRTDRQLPTTYRSRMAESAAFMQMEEVPGEPNAETAIALIEVHGDLARYRLHPVSGQKHQLRLHMAVLGMPIVNDRIYPVLQADDGDAPDYANPLKLLAKAIRFIDPLSGRVMQFESTQHLEF